jgi:2-oxoglutarate dehydrogenase E1 component
MLQDHLDTITPTRTAFSSLSLQYSSPAAGAAPAQLAHFIDAYRLQGYRIARLDPLGLTPRPDIPELTPQFHGLHPMQTFDVHRGASPVTLRVRELEWQLRRVYASAIGLDCSGVRNERQRRWLFTRMEATLESGDPGLPVRRALLRRLVATEMWERHVRDCLPSAKRFSLEGCESLIPLIEALIERCSHHGVQQVFMGMPHRGRLNMLVNVMGFDARHMLARLDKASDLAASQRDLPYHLGAMAVKRAAHGELRVSLAHNPSHLQSVYPVVCGMARAFQDAHPDLPCLPLAIHGDAAFAAQGIVMETLNLTRRSGYASGGTVHVIINNQIGFTTPNRINAHANTYCTDVARMVDAPVIHVNADHPDDVIRAADIALDYRMTFGSDVIVDLVGYRRLGHSEQDVPAVTQPFLHGAIALHPPVTERYHAAIHEPVALDTLRAEAVANLREGVSHATSVVVPEPATAVANDCPTLPALSLQQMQAFAAVLTTPPDGMPLHEHIRRTIDGWRHAIGHEERPVDWCFAENLAYASLLEAGHSVRISGMDVGRGTFMHRLAVWHAQAGAHVGSDVYMPLQHIAAHQGDFDIVDSPLSEEAVLGFEYGYSVQAKKRLTIWEAQYGDFANGAQVIIDQYIAAGEYKWGYQSALAVLLPHGHEGVGPEHSSGYLARFLQLCAGGNLRVVVPSTSAQWFHLLREQAASSDPKPLIVMSPKFQLYGNERSHAPLHELAAGSFAHVIGDAGLGTLDEVTRVVLCAGKLFYELHAARAAADDRTVALVRVEQLYPFPRDQVADALARFTSLAEIVWAQEEEKNHGAWHFVRDELEALLPQGARLSDVCRTATPSGAHASIRAHREEQDRIVAAALGKPV